MMRICCALTVVWLAASSAAAADAPVVRLHAAGSLRAAMTDMAKAYTELYGTRVEAVFGGSGGLQERLANGEPGDVFASADMGNPQALTRIGKSGPTVMFARNRLCALVRPGLKVTTETLLTTMLEPSVKIGTSTPKYDPAGDYAWELFKKADLLRPGSRATLEAKAVKIGNVPGSLAIPASVTNAVAWLFQEKRADIFLSYCTSAPAAESAGITILSLPPALQVEARYGLTILTSANKEAAGQFALYILSPAGQEILAQHGFTAPLLP